MMQNTTGANTSNGHTKGTKSFKKFAPKIIPEAFESCDVEDESPSLEMPNVYIPDWDNKPDEVKPVLSLKGVPVLTHQNTSAIIALPGMGKSSICESIGSSFLNPDADCLGFEVSQDCTGILIIDNERTNTDIWNSFNRMCRRAQVPYGKKVENVKIAGLRAVPRLNERLQVIEQLLKDNPCSMLLIDGAGDLVTDSNDLLQAIDCRIWLREITVKYNLSILTTLHPNPNTNKPRGHIGSEVHRECECVLLAKNAEGDIKILTSDFEHGKNRNNAKITTAYTWSEEHNMFITTDVDFDNVSKSKHPESDRTAIELLTKQVLPALSSLKRTALEAAIINIESCSEPTAKRRVGKMLQYGFIKKHEDGLYRTAI